MSPAQFTLLDRIIASAGKWPARLFDRHPDADLMIKSGWVSPVGDKVEITSAGAEAHRAAKSGFGEGFEGKPIRGHPRTRMGISSEILGDLTSDLRAYRKD